MRIRGQGREVLPARPGAIVAPVGGVGAVGVLRRGGAGVVAGGFGERGEARGQGGLARFFGLWQGRGPVFGHGRNLVKLARGLALMA